MYYLVIFLNFTPDRTSYERLYSMNLFINNTRIPLDPHPTFLGINLDPKLDFKKHFEVVSKRLEPKKNLIKRIKGLKLSNSLELCVTVFKSLIRSVTDYAFIPLSVATSKVNDDFQKIQNKILKTIRFFPIKTSTKSIHNYFKIELIKDRTEQLLKRFLMKKQTDNLISKEIENYLPTSQSSNEARFKTPFDLFIILTDIFN